jgi:hypothetical protein
MAKNKKRNGVKRLKMVAWNQPTKASPIADIVKMRDTARKHSCPLLARPPLVIDDTDDIPESFIKPDGG